MEEDGFVELHQAWFYVCDHCGRDNFIRAISVDLNDEEKEEYLSQIKEQIGDENSDIFDIQGGVYMAPNKVKCQFCHKAFNTVDEGDDNSDSGLE